MTTYHDGDTFTFKGRDFLVTQITDDRFEVGVQIIRARQINHSCETMAADILVTNKEIEAAR